MNYIKLSDKEYIERFRLKNGDYHNEEFILFLKKVLERLHNNPKFKFKYLLDDDIVCEQCDIREECQDDSSELHKLVQDLDQKAIKEFSKLELDKVYLIDYLTSR